MKIPIKIVPERLKDTIIEIRYKADLPFEYRLGLSYKVLTDLNLRTAIPFKTHPVEIDPANFLVFDVPKNLFENEVLRLSITEDRLIFNSNGNYKGWNTYFGFIQKIFHALFEHNLISNVTWIGLRYVSEFEQIQIFEQLTWNFKYEWKGGKSKNTIFKTEWQEGTDRIIINLVNNAQREDFFYSLMDIDVNHALNVSENISESKVMDCLNRLHLREKEVFFGLMKPEFLSLLNPEY